MKTKLNFNRNQRVEIKVIGYEGELASPVFVNDKLEIDTNGTFLGLLTQVNYDKIEVEPLKAGFIYIVKAKANFGDTLQPTANGFVVGDGVLQVIRKVNDEVCECIAVASSNGGGGQPQAINFDAIFPVGSIYVSNDDTFDPNVTFGGTWERVEDGRFLEAGDGANGKTKREAGLPNSSGTFGCLMVANAKQSGAATITKANRLSLGITAGNNPIISDTVMVNLNNGDRIYGSSNTVQPKSYVVNIWEKTALGGGAIPPAQGGNQGGNQGDYTQLTNKPSINGVELSGNKTTAELKLLDNTALTDYYNKTEVDAELDKKQDKLTAGANITISDQGVISAVGGGQAPDMTNYYTKTEVDGLIQQDTDTTYTAGEGLKLTATEFSIDDTKVTTKTAFDTKVAELENLIKGKADANAIPNVADFATKDELNLKANVADIPQVNDLATKVELTALQNELNAFKQNFAINPNGNTLVWTEAEYNALQTKENKVYMIRAN